MNPVRWGIAISLALHLCLAGAVVAFGAWSAQPPEPYRLEFDFNFSASAGGQAAQSAVAATSKPKPKARPKRAPKRAKKAPPKKTTEAATEPPAAQEATPEEPVAQAPEPPEETASAQEPQEPPEDDPGLRRNYVRAHSRQLVRAISANFDYPEMARQRGWAGKVLVAVLIGVGGEITGLEVVKSSGYALLDQSALTTLQAIKRLPAPPRPTRLILPIMFQLNES